MQNDLIFRRAFRKLEPGQRWLRQLLQGHALELQIDWKKLRIAPAATVDARLRRHEADLVLIAPLRCGLRHAIFVIEFAHGNKRAAWRQLLRYTTQEVDKLAPSMPKGRSPVVVPILVHTGKRPFDGIRAIDPQHPVRGDHAGFAFCIAVEDFATRDEAEIRSMPLPEPILLAALFAQFVHGRSPDEVEANVLRWRDLLRTVCGDPLDADEAQVYATYILETTQLSLLRCEQLFVKIFGENGGQPMKTTASQLRQEAKEMWLQKGISEGRSEGLSQGQAKVLLAQLRRRFGKLTRAQQKHIETATESQLEAIALRILDAKTIREALDG